MKPRTLRLDDDLDAKLELASTVLDITVTDCIRTSLTTWFDTLEEDPEFLAKLDETLKRTNRLFGRQANAKPPRSPTPANRTTQ